MGFDFLMMQSREKKGQSAKSMVPVFKVCRSKDLMIRGANFYALYDEESGFWITDEFRAIEMIDNEIMKAAQAATERGDPHYAECLFYSPNGLINKWHEFCKKLMIDNYHQLDDNITFLNTIPKKSDFASKALSYSIEKAPIPGYKELIGTLYSQEEREKIEWCIGSIISGDSKQIQKFAVLYGSGGTGKSTILHIIEGMFDGYCCTFEANAITSKSDQFSLEPFKNNPLVAVQHDGDLSRIEDNSRLNSLVSHEELSINEKFKARYKQHFNCFLFMGTNRPVQITDSRSGLIRRLIDIRPTGQRVTQKRYNELMDMIKFEYGGIAEHCLSFYSSNKHKYDAYFPSGMMDASNDIYNFIMYNMDALDDPEGISLKTLYTMYKAYCDEADVKHPYSRRVFKEEIKNYFEEYESEGKINGVRAKEIFKRIKLDKFHVIDGNAQDEVVKYWIDLKEQHSLLDDELANELAQYASEETEKPIRSWDNVTKKLSDLKTSKLHYVKVPENHIVIDFDIKDQQGRKDFQKNLEAASKWPPTYAELSKSGAGIHLHYLYSGDTSQLSNIYADSIEIKVFRGKSSLRRKLTKCNDIPIQTISSGLPRREKGKVINYGTIANEEHLKALIQKALRREIGVTEDQIAKGELAHTKPMVDFIGHILEQAYNSGMTYDVDKLRPAVLQFASSSHNQSTYCVDLVSSMPFKSSDESFTSLESRHRHIVIFDTEVFPNLFLLNYKIVGDDTIHRMINPTNLEVASFIENPDYDLVGFNCRHYDNHILFARAYDNFSNEDLYKLSQRIIVEKDSTAFFSEAYNISYTDIWDFATNKQSLKKWELQLGIHHKELGLPWDQPVPKEKWEDVSLYCDNDVIATEKVWLEEQGEFKAREILVDLVKNYRGIEACPNDPTNTLTKRLIFGANRSPQSAFVYRFLGEKPDHGKAMEFHDAEKWTIDIFKKYKGDMESCVKEAKRRYEEEKIVPWWPGYTFHVQYGADNYIADIHTYDEAVGLVRSGIPVNSKISSDHKWSTYREYDGSERIVIDAATGKKKKGRNVIGEGGLVFAVPGMYQGIRTQDSASHHPHSMYRENIFGDEYTQVMWDLVQARIYIKHGDFEEAGNLFDGALKPYLDDPGDAKALSKALKIAINSIYGLTSAKFLNEFRDPRNIDNFVAKRGALYMVDLKNFIQSLGFKVVHVKTDSIKVADITDDLITIIRTHAALYGYDFETEEIYDRFCLVNDAAYIARRPDGSWEAKGDEFLQKYTKKALFTKEPITFDDLCVVKEVKKGAIYINEEDGSELYEVDNDPILLDFGDGATNRYKFVGRVGEFTPVKEGGGRLTCINGDRIGAVSGTKDYKWLESEFVKELGEDTYKNLIDISYFEEMANATKEKLCVYGDFEWFVSDSKYVEPEYVEHPWSPIEYPVYPDEVEFA